MPMREFCGFGRSSVSRAVGTLLNGIAPKFVPMPLPAVADRKTVVKSRNPIGVI
jgi:hypothetical protein